MTTLKAPATDWQFYTNSVGSHYVVALTPSGKEAVYTVEHDGTLTLENPEKGQPDDLGEIPSRVRDTLRVLAEYYAAGI